MSAFYGFGQAPLLEAKSFSYIWNIDHFSSKQTSKAYLESPFLPILGAKKAQQWCIRAYPRGRNEKSEHLSLVLVSNHDTNACAKLQLSILNDKKEIFKSNGSRVCRPIRQGEILNYEDFITRTTLFDVSNALLTNDTLTILCEVCVVDDTQSNIAQQQLSEDLGTLLDNDKFMDVKLIVSGQEFKAHKAILASRSAVFAAMFDHDMEEQKLNSVSISDIDPIVFEQMLHYMYTGKAPNIDDMAGDLLAAADKYAMTNLKVMCENSFRTNITVEKAAYTLILADRHNSQQLKSETIDFIIKNAIKVVSTQGWKDMITTHAYLIAEAFYASAIGPCPKKT